MKIALFMFIRLSLSKGLETRFKVSGPDGDRRAPESGSILSIGTFSDYDPEILAPTASRRFATCIKRHQSVRTVCPTAFRFRSF
jgi:hypothetical protein